MQQVVLRRQLLGNRAGVGVVRLWTLVVSTALVLIAGGTSVRFSLLSIQAAGSIPLSESSAFSGLSISFGVMAMPFAMWSVALFSSWGRDDSASSIHPTRSRDELARV